MQIHPSAFDREIKAGLVFCWRCLQLKQPRTIDCFDINPAVLNGLEGMTKLEGVYAQRLRDCRRRGW
jgi:hypothetical protein